ALTTTTSSGGETIRVRPPEGRGVRPASDHARWSRGAPMQADENLPEYDGGSSDETGPDLEDLRRSLLDELGVESDFGPDELSPAVNEARLLAFVRDELPPGERDEVIALIAGFRPWLRGWAMALRRHLTDRG